ncbi:MAG: hypothetical protein LBI64_05970 [Coriobacteriales bacterium]|jgi:hypothetical protein|nr:hypothetical protein [Coriobacteriales bacterium]
MSVQEEAMSPVFDDEFDPLADDEEEREELTVIGADLDSMDTEVPTDAHSTREHLDRLFEIMPGQKPVLLGIIDFCREPQSATAVDAKTLELKEHRYSIYTPVGIRELLEKIGALVYLPAETVEDEPNIIEEELTDGENSYELSYLEVQEKPQGTWLATPEGLELLDEQDPQGDLRSLLADDLIYLDIYKRILAFCAESGGRNIKQIDDLIKDEALLQKPRKYGGYFVERLEKCEALLWEGTWITSPLGRAVIQPAAAKDALVEPGLNER